MQLAPADLHLARHARLREGLRAASLDALIVTSLPNIAYLTGLFASTAALLVSEFEVCLFVDNRYLAPAEARQAALGLRLTVVTSGGNFEDTISDAARSFSGGRIGLEGSHMTVRQHRYLESRLSAESGAPSLIETGAWSKTSSPWRSSTARTPGSRSGPST